MSAGCLRREFEGGWLLAVGLAVASLGACRPSGGGNEDEGHHHDGDVGDHHDGSDEDTGTAGTRLISHASWSRTSASDDPLASHRPETVDCPDDASGREQLQGDASLAVKTDQCNYYSGQQSLLAPIEKGDRLRARLFHFDLTSDRTAEAHVAILLDGAVAWEKRLTIPADGKVDSDVLVPSWKASSSFDTGATVTFHLHNHGSNQWNFVAFRNMD
ncbi:MAG: hypothetical protein ABEL76_17085 [Bradymonadaceae bacterium]